MAADQPGDGKPPIGPMTPIVRPRTPNVAIQLPVAQSAPPGNAPKTHEAQVGQRRSRSIAGVGHTPDRRHVRSAKSHWDPPYCAAEDAAIINK